MFRLRNRFPSRTVRTMFAASLLLAAAACSSSPTAPSAMATATLSDAATQAKSPAGPALFDGVWVQNPGMVIPQAGGGTANAWIRLALIQKGSTITGEARRFVSTWDAAGTPVLVAFDMGSPGKVTGTANNASASIVIRDFSEGKVTFALALAASADDTTLTTATANNYAIQTFTR